MKTPLTHKSREEEGGDQDEPVDDRHQSFEAAGLEYVEVIYVEVIDGNHEGSEGPTAIEPGFCNWV